MIISRQRRRGAATGHLDRPTGTVAVRQEVLSIPSSENSSVIRNGSILQAHRYVTGRGAGPWQQSNGDWIDVTVEVGMRMESSAPLPTWNRRSRHSEQAETDTVGVLDRASSALEGSATGEARPESPHSPGRRWRLCLVKEIEGDYRSLVGRSGAAPSSRAIVSLQSESPQS